jgi:hypothetical protein
MKYQNGRKFGRFFSHTTLGVVIAAVIRGLARAYHHPHMPMVAWSSSNCREPSSSSPELRQTKHGIRWVHRWPQKWRVMSDFGNHLSHMHMLNQWDFSYNKEHKMGFHQISSEEHGIKIDIP